MKRLIYFSLILCGLAFGQGLTLKNPAYVATLKSAAAAGGGGGIAWTHKDAGNSASASFTTASVSFTAGSRAFLTLGLSCVGGTAPGADDSIEITGGGTTWTRLSEVIFGVRRVLYVFISDATPTSGTIDVDWDNNGSDGVWEQGTYSIDEATCNTTTPTSNFATATGVGTSGTVTIGGTVHAGDHTVFFVGHATSETVTLEASLTGLHAATGLTGLRTFNFAYRPTTERNPPTRL